MIYFDKSAPCRVTTQRSVMPESHDIHLTELARLFAGGELGSPELLGLSGFSSLNYDERTVVAERLMSELETHQGEHRSFLDSLNALIKDPRAQLSALREAMVLAEKQLAAG